MSPPTVSIVMATYNGVRFLNDAIASVRAQTVDDWELILVDDHSTDGTRELISRFERQDSRIRVLSTPGNSGGPARPKNVGIAAARGRYITILDQDDVYLPTRLERLIGVLECHEDIDVVFSDYFRMGTHGELAKSTYLSERRFLDRARLQLTPLSRNVFRLEAPLDVMLPGPMGMATQGVLFRSKAVPVLGYCFDETYSICDDIDLWLRFAAERGIAFLDEPHCLYRYHEGALTTRGALLTDEALRAKSVAYVRFAERLTTTARGRIRSELSKLAAEAAYNRLNEGRIREAVGTAIRSVKYRPNRLAMKVGARALIGALKPRAPAPQSRPR